MFRLLFTLFLVSSSALIADGLSKNNKNVVAKITTIDAFKDVEQDLSSLPTDSLVVFDIDEVLITFADKGLSAEGYRFVKQQFKILPDTNVLSIVFSQGKHRLVDPQAPDVIQALNKRGIPTIALSASRTGSYGIIPSFENLRIEELKAFNIDFSSSFRELPEHSFTTIATDKEHPPVFKKGLLLVGADNAHPQNSKGEVLVAFLEWANLAPKVILFFDDKISNLVSVQEELTKKGIPFKGFLFTGYKQEPINEQVARFQFQTLLEQKKWLSDQEAEALLQQK